MINDEKILVCIEQMLDYALFNLTLSEYDIDYARNAFLDIFKLPCPIGAEKKEEYTDIQLTVDKMVEYAIEKGIITSDENILFETKLFGIITPTPSSVIDTFINIEASEGTQAATSWLFDLSKANNYIRMIDINRNIMWEHSGKHGDLVVTINLSKPEKDPKQIAAALKAKTGYPACMLCSTNVGFAGNAAHPARQTLRIIPVSLNEEDWAIQFSPYQYYNEHLIALCYEHRPMEVNRDCLARLVDFVDQFPHYFMGSNAALPIVGGSILTHDHYQGGGKDLPMFNAPIRKKYKSPFKGVDIFTVDWYNSVVRVSGKNKEAVCEASSEILNIWKNYSDERVGIICKTDAQHNAVTPIARYEDGKFIVDMILRNNRADAQHPFGIYHPTEDLHNIKKEGIGIIEVMGTFILPGRLDNELKEIAKFLTGELDFDYNALVQDNHPLRNHKDMIKNLINKNGNSNTKECADTILKNYINQTCEQILECTAVYKNTQEGMDAFERFMEDGIGCK